MLRSPQALLLDFGGVLADAPPQPAAPPELINRLYALVARAVSAEQIARDLHGGARAYSRWRDDVGSGASPTELNHEQVWADFVTPRWPAPAQEAVRREATPLSYAWTWRAEWAIRPGIPEVLRTASAAGLPLAVVSNTLCGAAHRDFLADTGLANLFAVQFYSDEIGVRKPNPEFARIAGRAVGVAVEDCWFIGDTIGRDIACARRAGVGAAILMRSPRTAGERHHLDLAPDATVDDGHGLDELLGAALHR